MRVCCARFEEARARSIHVLADVLPEWASNFVSVLLLGPKGTYGESECEYTYIYIYTYGSFYFVLMKGS